MLSARCFLASAAARLARGAGSGLWQGSESHLPKMTIRRDHLCQSDIAHHHETRAIGEREVFVAILKEQVPRFLEPVAVDPLPSEAGSSIDLVPPRLGGVQSESKSKKCERLIGHEVRRDESLTGLESGSDARRRLALM